MYSKSDGGQDEELDIQMGIASMQALNNSVVSCKRVVQIVKLYFKKFLYPF